jgi:hypothetical protein
MISDSVDLMNDLESLLIVSFRWVDCFQGSLLHAIEYAMLLLDVSSIRSSPKEKVCQI